MPFLEEIITIVDLSSIEAQECIRLLVTTYIDQTVGKEPKKPSDWARPEEMDPQCECDDCSEMNAFLQDLELQHYIFSCTDTRHLETRFNYLKYSKVETIDRNPTHVNSTIVAKTLKWWEEQHQKWESRASDALEALRKLPQASLKHCLAHQYDEIMNLQIVKITDNPHESANQGQLPYET